MEGPVIRRTEAPFAAAGGFRLFRRSWLPATPERAVVLVHGYAEHSGRYEHVGAWLAARGCAVLGYDQRGHGCSDGPRGHARSFDALLDDLDRVLEAARAEHPGLPLFTLGHSMGGLVVATHARERRPALTGAATSGAALSIPDVPGPATSFALRWLRRVAPRVALRRPIAPDALSRDPEVGRRYLEDPLVFRRISLALAADVFAASERTRRGAADVEVPMLLLHGEADALCLPSGSREFFDGLRVSGSDLRFYPGLRHEIFNEPERESVLGDLLDWLRKTEAA